tara:strand:- start:8235 stop:8915 length:681 start_codon:yes stop_codon:yes gene_type:complete
MIELEKYKLLNHLIKLNKENRLENFGYERLHNSEYKGDEQSHFYFHLKIFCPKRNIEFVFHIGNTLRGEEKAYFLDIKIPTKYDDSEVYLRRQNKEDYLEILRMHYEDIKQIHPLMYKDFLNHEENYKKSVKKLSERAKKSKYTYQFLNKSNYFGFFKTEENLEFQCFLFELVLNGMDYVLNYEGLNKLDTEEFFKYYLKNRNEVLRTLREEKEYAIDLFLMTTMK